MSLFSFGFTRNSQNETDPDKFSIDSPDRGSRGTKDDGSVWSVGVPSKRTDLAGPSSGDPARAPPVIDGDPGTAGSFEQDQR